MSCDMCGADGSIKKGLVEGVEMKLCPKCLGFSNKVIEQPRARRRFVKKEENKIELAVVPKYSSIIKNAREKTGKKQEDIAKELNIKESLLSHFESGKTKPSINNAKKLEKYFKIRLIMQVHEGEVKIDKSSNNTEGLTLGDFIKKKNRF